MLTGMVNAAAGGAVVLWLFRRDLRRRTRWLLVAANATVLLLLASATVLAEDFERIARNAVYGGEVRVAVQTGIQELVVTGPGSGSPRSLDLYLDGRLRVSGYDEYRYHEALVHPAMQGPHARVLVLGGGEPVIPTRQDAQDRQLGRWERARHRLTSVWGGSSRPL